MKQLIIGIDGGTKAIFEKMDMPFFQKLLADNPSPRLEIDLLSRGWAEQLTGKYARDTKGFYRFPLLDGTRKTVLKYSLEKMLSHDDVTPIWEIPQSRGIRVGVMNIPTTFPAPKVDGFFVSGAGGGINKVDGVPEKMCYPSAIAKRLEEAGYVIDLRPGTAGITDVGELFQRLTEMLENRCEAFLSLCSQHDPKFAFLAFRVATVVQYLAMSELEAVWGCNFRNENEIDPVWAGNIAKLYRKIDECFERIFSHTNPEQWIFSSDHSIVPYYYRCNGNAFLEQSGFQNSSINFTGTAKSLAKTLLRKSKFGVRRTIDFETTKAFCDWYVSAVFVNDEKRFGGPVKESELNDVVDQICEKFNSHTVSKKHEMKAMPYRRNHLNARYEQFLPDIKVDCHESIFFVKEGPFMSENPDYERLPDLTSVKGSMHSGQKGRHPLFVCDQKTRELIDDKDPLDLTLIYKLTERIFS